MMKVARWCATAVLVLGLIAVAAPTGRAQTTEEDPGTALYGAEPWVSDETERWWGAVGAAVCGAEMWLIRTNPVVGMHPGPLAAGIAGCLLALLDATT